MLAHSSKGGRGCHPVALGEDRSQWKVGAQKEPSPPWPCLMGLKRVEHSSGWGDMVSTLQAPGRPPAQRSPQTTQPTVLGALPILSSCHPFSSPQCLRQQGQTPTAWLRALPQGLRACGEARKGSRALLSLALSCGSDSSNCRPDRPGGEPQNRTCCPSMPEPLPLQGTAHQVGRRPVLSPHLGLSPGSCSHCPPPLPSEHTREPKPYFLSLFLLPPPPAPVQGTRGAGADTHGADTHNVIREDLYLQMS